MFNLKHRRKTQLLDKNVVLMNCLIHFLVDNLCISGWYGQNCSMQCSKHCLNNTPCDPVDGTCQRGCSPGYRGSMCTEGKEKRERERETEREREREREREKLITVKLHNALKNP